MKSFISFFKKEVLEGLRSGKLTILGILFLMFGIMNPAIAKLTPWMLEMFSESLAESGMTVTDVTVTALTSWTQFFKNIPMALIAFVLIYSGIFTREYDSGTLVLILTKGLSRYKTVLAKASLMLILWTLGYWFCFAVTYAYNAYFWDNSIAVGLMHAVLNWWLFGLWVISLTVLFSVLFKNYSGVLLGTGVCVLLVYLLSFLPDAKDYTPTSLMNSAALLVGAEKAEIYVKSIVTTVLTAILAITSSIFIFNKKQL
ncbi:MAG: ABC transporter permease [Ruminococcaceae bacterium]|nr:ABC transporter permease [Oscillospiraceae bacterium]